MEDELNLGHLWRHLKAPLTHLYSNTGCARGQSLADVWLLFYLFFCPDQYYQHASLHSTN